MCNLSTKKVVSLWAIVLALLMSCTTNSPTPKQSITREAPSLSPEPISAPIPTKVPIPTSSYVEITNSSSRPLLSGPAHGAFLPTGEIRPGRIYVVLRGPVTPHDTAWYEIAELKGNERGWIEEDLLFVLPPTPTLIPTATRPPTPRVVIVDVHNEQTKDVSGTPIGELAILVNMGQGINLLGWSITNSRGEKYVFRDVVLQPETGILLHSEQGVDSDMDLYWGRETEAWHDDGDVAILKDSSGREIDRYSY